MSLLKFRVFPALDTQPILLAGTPTIRACGLMFFVILVGFGFTTLAPYFATKQLSTKIQTDTDELVQTHIQNIGDYL